MLDAVRHLSLIALAAVTVAGCNPATTLPAKQGDGAVEPQLVVTTNPQRKTLVLSTTQPGRIEAFEVTPLFSKTAGYVGEVLVDIGDTVKKDQTLIELSIPELNDDVAQKVALIAQREAEVQQAKSSIKAARAAADSAQARIKETEAGIERAEAEYDRWKSEHARIKELADKGSITKKLQEETYSQLRSAQAGTSEAAAKAESARTAWSGAQANVGKAEADLGAADASLHVAESELERAKTMLSYTHIKAPFDGVVTRREVDTGHFVQPAGGTSKPLMVVARTDKVRIFVDVPELEAAHVDAGDPARIRIQATGVPEFDAKVTRSSWSLQESNRSLKAEIDVANPQGALRPGMYGTATIQLASRENALVLPAASIVRDAAGAACFGVESDQVVRYELELGLRSGNEVEILSGINESHAVVLKPEGLKVNQRVSVAGRAPK